jgi:hypothetical protein
VSVTVVPVTVAVVVTVSVAVVATVAVGVVVPVPVSTVVAVSVVLIPVPVLPTQFPEPFNAEVQTSDGSLPQPTIRAIPTIALRRVKPIPLFVIFVPSFQKGKCCQRSSYRHHARPHLSVFLLYTLFPVLSRSFTYFLA